MVISPLSRRSFLQTSAAASAALTFRFVSEPMLAHAAAPDHAARRRAHQFQRKSAGPLQRRASAVAAIAPESGRYFMERTHAFEKQFADSIGVTEEHVAIYPGSTPPLIFAVHAWCSPQASYATADPGFEAGLFTGGARAGARVSQSSVDKNVRPRREGHAGRRARCRSVLRLQSQQSHRER